MVTVAPGSTAPDWSFTVPRIVPVSTWALVGADSSMAVANANRPPLPSSGWTRIPSPFDRACAPEAHVSLLRDQLAVSRDEPSLSINDLQVWVVLRVSLSLARNGGK